MEFTHNLGLMCDVLSELNDLSKQSESKKRGRDEVGETGGRKEEVTEKKKKKKKKRRSGPKQELCWNRFSLQLPRPMVPASLLEQRCQGKHGLLQH